MQCSVCLLMEIQKKKKEEKKMRSRCKGLENNKGKFVVKQHLKNKM